jgi:hypothetical protein
MEEATSRAALHHGTSFAWPCEQDSVSKASRVACRRGGANREQMADGTASAGRRAGKWESEEIHVRPT